MLELLLIDELERIGKKDLAKRVYEGGVTEEVKQELYPIFLKVVSDKERKALTTINRGITRIEKRLSKAKNPDSITYMSLVDDLDRLQKLRDFKLDGNYHLKNADDKYLACAICSCLKRPEEENIEKQVKF